MEPSRDELREHLVAAIEAAPEMAREDRRYLADAFFDRLNADFDLVPRGTGKKGRPEKAAGRPSRPPVWVKVVVGLILFLFLANLAVHHFLAVLLAAVIIFVIVKATKSHRSSTAT